MRNAFVSPPLRPAFAALLLFMFVGLAGCEPPDPLAGIREQHAAGDFEGSLEPLRKLLAERPEDAELHYLHGRTLSLLGQPSLAQWSLRKAMDDPEWLAEAGQQLAADALRVGDYATTIAATTRILEEDPENVTALLLRANAHTISPSQQGQEEALVDVDRVLELDPENADVLQPRILALLNLDRIDEAAEAIEALGDWIETAQLGPDGESWHCATMAILADESGELELARERWADCVERFPSDAGVVNKAVGFHDAQREFDRSLEILRAALEAAPTSRGFRSSLAQRLRSRGETEEAEGLLREATQLENQQIAIIAWFELAEHYQAIEDYAAGARAAERGMELAREAEFSHPQLLLEAADAFVLAGELDKAVAVTDEMTLDSHRELMLARVFQERGQPGKALEHYEEAFRLWPDNAVARYQAALAAEAVGDFDLAIEAYRYAIRLDPAATDARTRIARLHAAEGKPVLALEVLRLRADRVPLELEGELLSFRLWARLGKDAPLERQLRHFRSGRPAQLGRALASAAEGLRDRAGAATAVDRLRRAQGVDLEDPMLAEALRVLVRFSHEAGVLEAAESRVRAALRAHPEDAALHEINALALELGGASADSVLEAYERALELDPQNARALVGVGRLALEREPEQALVLFDRAAAADPDDAAPRRAAARALLAIGQQRAAEERLEALLHDHPYDADASMRIVELRLEGGAAETEQTLELAERAVRFGGGADALDLLERVHRRRNELVRASEAAARAQALRERQAPDA
jgi:tetratricopeptide (TPR) repeat protein